MVDLDKKELSERDFCTKFITDKLVPQDPADEPAEKLLNRIQDK